MNSFLKYFLATLILFLCPILVFAKIDVSISETDITFSKEAPTVGETIKIYARVFNTGDTDVVAFVDFLNNGKEMALPQQISIRPNTYDDVFVDWKVTAGINNISAKIVGINPTDENVKNNVSEKKELVISTPVSVQQTKSTEEPAKPTLSPTVTDIPSTSNSSFLPADIQQGLDNFAESNPIKNGIKTINQNITDQAKKWFHLDLVKPIDSSKLTSNFSGALKDINNYIYAGLGVVFLTVLYLFWRGFKGRDEES